MTLQGTRLVIAVVDIQAPGLPDPLQTLWEAARGRVLASVSTAIVMDLVPTLGGLGMPAPVTSALELLSDAVSVRLDAGRPIGTQPHIDAQMVVQSPLPDTLAGHARITVGLGIELSVVQTLEAQLRTLVQWAVQDIELHSDLPGVLEALSEAVIKAFLLDELAARHFSPASVGGTALGPAGAGQRLAGQDRVPRRIAVDVRATMPRSAVAHLGHSGLSSTPGSSASRHRRGRMLRS